MQAFSTHPDGFNHLRAGETGSSPEVLLPRAYLAEAQLRGGDGCVVVTGDFGDGSQDVPVADAPGGSRPSTVSTSGPLVLLAPSVRFRLTRARCPALSWRILASRKVRYYLPRVNTVPVRRLTIEARVGL